ncbi:hypothetical protein OAK31_02295 [Gammaproteobacteria bacterium]|nr:hypothetical protein [Gammaproteobacteria bacterium]
MLSVVLNHAISSAKDNWLIFDRSIGILPRLFAVLLQGVGLLIKPLV